MEKFDDYRKLRFSLLLKNGNKKFKNKIKRSSTIKNRALHNFIKKTRKKQEVHIRKREKFDDHRKLSYSSLLKNGNKKFKNKISRSSTFKK